MPTLRLFAALIRKFAVGDGPPPAEGGRSRQLDAAFFGGLIAPGADAGYLQIDVISLAMFLACRTARPGRLPSCRAHALAARIVFQCGIEAAQERLAVKRLVQKSDGASNQRLSAGPFVGKRSDENNRYLMTPRTQSVVQLDSAHLRHLDVGNQT